MARAAKSPARARPKGYAAPTNGKATKKSSAARTSTKFLHMPLWTLAQELSPDCNYNVASARNWLAWGLARSPFFLLLFNSFLEFWIGYFPKDAFNARDLTKCPEVNKIFGIEVEPRFCTPTNVDGQQDDTTGDEYKAK